MCIPYPCTQVPASSLIKSPHPVFPGFPFEALSTFSLYHPQEYIHCDSERNICCHMLLAHPRGANKYVIIHYNFVRPKQLENSPTKNFFTSPLPKEGTSYHENLIKKIKTYTYISLIASHLSRACNKFSI